MYSKGCTKNNNSGVVTMRILFSSEYLDSDCDPSLYVEDDAFDDTIGTWLTNYAIFAASFFFAIKFASCPPYKRKTNIELITNHSEEEIPNSAQEYDLEGEEDKGTKQLLGILELRSV